MASSTSTSDGGQNSTVNTTQTQPQANFDTSLASLRRHIMEGNFNKAIVEVEKLGLMNEDLSHTPRLAIQVVDPPPEAADPPTVRR
ncbi:unnamed protein product [Didymodactylos carnosus]|uniref:Uncharacterized protein n=1 Tax=Didymodactylos carnosus TaxID=1234261 RepID=A0A814P595_9BILA|nr:unnamed protein product [Didymodactylos carnosus]CAF1103082.1 unnamed protein product [Didymodactylos carnosus]CAF3720169.1 unnamed protein product [Didymodactylos carnosus]CAF3867855.1 unnamed protein product [Didymodactylos carnosus]